MWFQHAAARRRLGPNIFCCADVWRFQHAAARRRLDRFDKRCSLSKPCFNTQPPEGGWEGIGDVSSSITGVSTRSRPKAAGNCLHMYQPSLLKSFNTQPPEGGWELPTYVPAKSIEEFQHAAARRRLEEKLNRNIVKLKFQHAAARRRLGVRLLPLLCVLMFQHAAARRRLAGATRAGVPTIFVSTRSRPKAAGSRTGIYMINTPVSTRSRPKAAGFAATCPF